MPYFPADGDGLVVAPFLRVCLFFSSLTRVYLFDTLHPYGHEFSTVEPSYAPHLRGEGLRGTVIITTYKNTRTPHQRGFFMEEEEYMRDTYKRTAVAIEDQATRKRRLIPVGRGDSPYHTLDTTDHSVSPTKEKPGRNWVRFRRTRDDQVLVRWNIAGTICSGFLFPQVEEKTTADMQANEANIARIGWFRVWLYQIAGSLPESQEKRGTNRNRR